MARYVVMQNGGNFENAEFIRDGFSLPALIVPHLWLAFHRQWLAVIAVVSVMVLGALAAWQWSAPLLALGADLFISLYVAFEGATLRIANLERDGWQEVAVLEAGTAEEAEIRYFGALPDKGSFTPASLTNTFGRTNAFAFPERV